MKARYVVRDILGLKYDCGRHGNKPERLLSHYEEYVLKADCLTCLGDTTPSTTVDEGGSREEEEDESEEAEVHTQEAGETVEGGAS